ncbi:MAG: cytochrome o ubiquinol oxidase subunit III [Candidatus Saccharimonadales bacterium]
MSHIKFNEFSEHTSLFGFWTYLMTDAVIFGTLFAVYAVMRNNTFGGPSANGLFDLKFVLVETLVLLMSSFTCGLALISLQGKKLFQIYFWLIVTLLLGGVFLLMEVNEFSQLLSEGFSWTTSGFLSAYYVLVGTHGLHVLVGLLWILFIIYQVYIKGLKPVVSKRIKMLGIYWHFLEVIWIFIFTFVYLAGVIKL